MAVHTSLGSFESGSITQEQRMEVWAKKPMKFTRTVKPTSPREMVNPNLRGDVFHIRFPRICGIEQRTTRKQVVKNL